MLANGSRESNGINSNSNELSHNLKFQSAQSVGIFPRRATARGIGNEGSDVNECL